MSACSAVDFIDERAYIIGVYDFGGDLIANRESLMFSYIPIKTGSLLMMR